MVPRIKTEVRSLESVGDGTRVKVRVEAFEPVPEAFMELRARARALAATGFATTGGEIVDNASLGEIDRFTDVTSKNKVGSNQFRKRLDITVTVDTPF
jgi:hypothetical protein